MKNNCIAGGKALGRQFMWHRAALRSLIAPCLALMIIAGQAYATTIRVTSSNTISDDAACTLRETITNANTDSQLYSSAWECDSGSAADCSTWDDACSLATALTTANSGDEIRVAVPSIAMALGEYRSPSQHGVLCTRCPPGNYIDLSFVKELIKII